MQAAVQSASASLDASFDEREDSGKSVMSESSSECQGNSSPWKVFISGVPVAYISGSGDVSEISAEDVVKMCGAVCDDPGVVEDALLEHSSCSHYLSVGRDCVSERCCCEYMVRLPCFYLLLYLF